MNSAEASYAQAIHEVETKEIERIGRLIAAGEVNSLDLARSPTYGGLFGYKAQLRTRLLQILADVGKFGRQQVKQELRRQGA